MRNKKLILILMVGIISLSFFSLSFAQGPINIPDVEIKVGGESGLSSTIQILIVLTILTLAPSIIMMMTSFTRIVIILSFMRKALSLQTTPPNQVLIGLSLFLTFFIMSPVFSEIYTNAYEPLSNGEITQEVAFEKAMNPMREYMFNQVRTKDLALFVKISGGEEKTELDDISTAALIPAFIISELKTAFIVGFMLFIPFIIIDMVVASTLMSLGMMMLPPVMISLPFKVLLFIMVDGWNLLTKAIIAGINI